MALSVPLNFPDAPLIGDQYPGLEGSYIYDGEKWVIKKSTVLTGVPAPPSFLTGLLGWWDCSVYASLVFSGPSITSMADQSGLGNTMTYYNVRPRYEATGFNGRPVMPYDVGAGYKVTPFAMGTGNTMTMWLVSTVAMTTSFGDARIFSYYAPGFSDWNAPGSWAFTRSGSTVSTVGFGHNSQFSVATPLPYPTIHRFICTVKSDGLITLYVNGLASPSIATTGSWVSGGNLCMGAANGGGNWYGGTVAEFGVATDYSDDVGVRKLDNYLKMKWGMVV